MMLCRVVCSELTYQSVLLENQLSDLEAAERLGAPLKHPHGVLVPQVPHRPLHHLVLRQDVHWDRDGLGEDGGRAPGDEPLPGRRQLAHPTPHHLVRHDVQLSRHHAQAADKEPLVQPTHPLLARDLAEGVQHSSVQLFLGLHLQPRLDHAHRVEAESHPEEESGTQDEEFKLVQVFPFYYPYTFLLLHHLCELSSQGDITQHLIQLRNVIR